LDRIPKKVEEYGPPKKLMNKGGASNVIPFDPEFGPPKSLMSAPKFEQFGPPKSLMTPQVPAFMRDTGFSANKNGGFGTAFGSSLSTSGLSSGLGGGLTTGGLGEKRRVGSASADQESRKRESLEKQSVSHLESIDTNIKQSLSVA
jgi:hypothetical protein